MFTGIIEAVGWVKQVISNGSNKTIWIESPISGELKIDQSVSHNGVCLTVEETKGSSHRVTAIRETLAKTNLDDWREGSSVNLERCLRLNDRIDGHIVQGHIDTTGICERVKEKDGSWEFDISFPPGFASLVIEKGSVSVNGISLTAFNVRRRKFRVAVIPYTFSHTNIQHVKKGDAVNLEFDMTGKYILRKLSLKEQ